MVLSMSYADDLTVPLQPCSLSGCGLLEQAMMVLSMSYADDLTVPL